jgi:DNA-binding transcriptional ArsR family regulator
MSVKLMARAWEMELPQGKKLLLLALCDHANDDGVCYPSQEKLMQKCGIGQTTLTNHIKWFEHAGLLTRMRRQKGRSRRSDLYQINLEICREPSKSEPSKSEPSDFELMNLQILSHEPSDFEGCFKEEPSINHQLEPSIIGTGVADAPTVPSDQVKKSKQANPDNVACWEAYAKAYRNRYGVLPAANQKTRGQVATLVRYVGKEVAPALAEYFLSHNGSWFVQCRHEFGCLLKSYQQVLTDMQRGEQMTQIKARQTESTQSNYEAARSALAMFQARGLA